MTTATVCPTCLGEAAIETATVKDGEVLLERCPNVDCSAVDAIERRYAHLKPVLPPPVRPHGPDLSNLLTRSLLNGLGRCPDCAHEVAHCTCTLPSSDPYWLGEGR